MDVSISDVQVGTKSRLIDGRRGRTERPAVLDDFLVQCREASIAKQAQARARDEQEWLLVQLVERHNCRLYRFVSKYVDHPDDAADIAQQAFVEAARGIGKFRGESKLSTWLYGIAMNMVRNYLSRSPHRLYKFETEEILEEFFSSAIDPSDQAEQKEMLSLVLEAMGDLPKEMSEVLTMVAVKEISYQEVATTLSIPLGTVRSRVSRARAVLREHFEKAHVSLGL